MSTSFSAPIFDREFLYISQHKVKVQFLPIVQKPLRAQWNYAQRGSDEIKNAQLEHENI